MRTPGAIAKKWRRTLGRGEKAAIARRWAAAERHRFHCIASARQHSLGADNTPSVFSSGRIGVAGENDRKLDSVVRYGQPALLQ